ncbi:MAG TPA: hypothetical protein VFK43_21250 [Acidimicrobiales bacterium]|nr:hypothetical protein [Acidimicrobiales bacterium]
MGSGTVTFADRVRPGDGVLDGGVFVVVTQVRRAQGRKPKVRENLHLVTDAGIVKVNSTDSVRVHRQAR